MAFPETVTETATLTGYAFEAGGLDMTDPQPAAVVSPQTMVAPVCATRDANA